MKRYPRRLDRLPATICLLACAVMLSGCTGELLSSADDAPHEVSEGADAGSMPRPGQDTSLEGGDDQGEVGGGDGGGAAVSPEGLARGGARRLGRDQYANAMRDLFGPEVQFPDDFEPDPVSHEGFRFSSALGYEIVTGEAGVGRYSRTADQIAQQVFSDAAWRERIVGCAPKGASDPCVRDYVRWLLERAFSRPVSEEQVDRYEAVVSTSAESLGLWTALEMVTSAIIQSPMMLYRAYVGEVATEGGEPRRFTGYEVADRLALLIWNSIPDEELLRAAREGELDAPVGVRAQAERMLGESAARGGLRSFFVEWLGLGGLLELSKDEDVFPTQTQTLGASMFHELTTYFESRVFDDQGDLFELFTSRRVYINEELRHIYGITEEPIEGDQWQWRQIPEHWNRGGLLTSPGLMALYASRTRTSPTLRGLFVLERLMCTPIDPAPDGLNVEELATPEPNETVRQWSERIRTNTQCAGCHSAMDPIGLVFEHFDGLGIHRHEEMGVPIVARGAVFGHEVQGAWELGAFLRADARIKACFVRQVVRYSNGADVPANDERVKAIVSRFEQSGHLFDELLLDIVASDLFLTLRQEP